MSDLLDRPAAGRRAGPDPARTLDVLATLFVVTIAVTALYVGRDIFVPIAIAILLSFVLSPPILLLRRAGLNRTLSVVVVVLASLFITFGVSAVLTRQVSELAIDLPKYETTINAKIGGLRDAVADNAVFKKGAAALEGFGEINSNRRSASEESSANTQKNILQQNDEAARPVVVEVHQPSPGPFEVLRTVAGTALSPLETLGVVVIFVIFILLQREDLRNRFIRLVGSNDLQRTTVAMNDAATRLSRFFLVQTLVNACFGLIVAAGLYLIGVPSPILFGITAFLLRFVPYIGSVIAAAFPIALAAAVEPGWAMALETLALFLIVDNAVSYIVEPWLYGQNTGISPIAVVVSATFWTWLWGPIGLVLSTPLTVCLVVLGKHVDQLDFLNVILGDAPALTPVENFYQRMLVGDASEVADQAEQFLKTNSLIAYYDEVALKALLMAQADVRRGVLDEPRQIRIKATIEEVIENLSDHVDENPDAPASEKAEPYAVLEPMDDTPAVPHEQPPAQAPAALASSPSGRKPVLCIAGRGPLDEAAAALFGQILEKHGVRAKIEPPEILTVGGIMHLSGTGAQIICLSYVDADVSVARARYAVRRLRRRLPEARIFTGFWLGDAQKAKELCAQANADFCATRLPEAVAFCVEQAQTADRSELSPAPGPDGYAKDGDAAPSPTLAGVA
jgi:predicted PurR-regulated permease PerM